jgi:GNAT superfamily N-acetyltransferase
MEIELALVDAPTTELRTLIEELNEVLAGPYDAEQRHGLALEQLFQPHIRFFIAWMDRSAVGCGGVALCDGYAEVKRMYVRPTARGHGVAKAVLARLADEARAAGVTVLRLETGLYQAEAIGLYERFGFIRCPAFGPYAALPARAIELSVFFEKPLAESISFVTT